MQDDDSLNENHIKKVLVSVEQKELETLKLLLVPRNSSRSRGVIPSLAELGEQSLSAYVSMGIGM
jgi:hypothetical protein